MPKFKCACGKKLSVSDSWAGKRVKCPECGNAVIVPGDIVVSTAETGDRSPKQTKPLARATDNADSFLDAIKDLNATGDPTVVHGDFASPSQHTVVNVDTVSHHDDESMPRPLIYGLIAVGAAGVLALVLTVIFVGGDPNPTTDSAKDASLAVTPRNPTIVSNSDKDASAKDDSDLSNKDHNTPNANKDSKQPDLNEGDPKVIPRQPWLFEPQPSLAIAVPTGRVCSFQASRAEITSAFVNSFEPASIIIYKDVRDREVKRVAPSPNDRKAYLEYIKTRHIRIYENDTGIEVALINSDRGAMKFDLPEFAVLLDVRGDHVTLLSPDHTMLSVHRMENRDLIDVGAVQIPNAIPIDPKLKNKYSNTYKNKYKSKPFVQAWLLDHERLIIANTVNNTVGLWRIGESAPQWEHHYPRVQVAGMSPTRHALIVAANDHLQVLNPEDGSPLGKLLIQETKSIDGGKICFSADGMRMTYFQPIKPYDVHARTWNMAEGKLIGEAYCWDYNSYWIGSGRFATLGNGLFDIETGTERWLFKHEGLALPIEANGTERLWYIADSRGKRARMMAVDPIGPETQTALNEPFDRSIYKLVPGEKIKLKLQLPLDATQLAKAKQYIVGELIAKQFSYDEKADVTLALTANIRAGRAHKFRNPTNRNQIVTISGLKTALTVTMTNRAGREIYSRQMENHVPPSLTFNTPSEARAELQKVAPLILMDRLKYFKLPRLIYDKSQTYKIQSILTADGVKPAKAPK